MLYSYIANAFIDFPSAIIIIIMEQIRSLHLYPSLHVTSGAESKLIRIAIIIMGA